MIDEKDIVTSDKSSWSKFNWFRIIILPYIIFNFTSSSMKYFEAGQTGFFIILFLECTLSE